MFSQREKIEKILETDTPNFSGYKKEKLFYLISRLYMGAMYKDEYGLGEKEGIPLYSPFLQRIIGKSYKLHLDYLTEKKIISAVSGYRPGEYSKSFKLTDDFIGAPEWYSISDYAFSKTLKKIKNSKNKKEQYTYLKKWLSQLNLDIEFANVTTNLSFELKKACPEYQDLAFGTNRLKDPARQSFQSKIVIENFKNGEMPFYVDEKGNRAHTILTRSNKSIRQFITCNGESLVSVDLKNSQPYLLLCLMNPKFFEKRGKNKPKQDQNYQEGINIKQSDIFPTSIPSIMLGLSSEILYSIEFQKYKKLVSSGGIYEFFEDKISYTPKLLNQGLSKRDLVKYWMMLCFYSKNGGYSGGMKSAFKMQFPKIYNLICKLKDKKHNTLALLLQRIESYLILDVICKRISIEKPDLPIFTIHDSIVTTVGNEEYVSRIVKEEMNNVVGIPPMVSIEYWTPKNVWNKFEKIDFELSQRVA
jgi:hypothetical protein